MAREPYAARHLGGGSGGSGMGGEALLNPYKLVHE